MESLAVTSINLSLNYMRFMYTLCTKLDKLTNYDNNTSSNQELETHKYGCSNIDKYTASYLIYLEYVHTDGLVVAYSHLSRLLG